MPTTSDDGPRTDDVRVRRAPQRGRYDRASLHDVLDATSVGHVGFVAEARPVVIPMSYGRDRGRERVYVHASVAGRFTRTLRSGADICFTVTVLDGVVLARSAFHHSLNYRSAVVRGVPVVVDDPDEHLHGLRVITEHVCPGRWDEVRAPNRPEVRQTAVLALDVVEFSVKVRTGGPLDEPDDLDLDVWAGEVPLRMAPGVPVPASDLRGDPPLSPSVRRLLSP